MVSIRIVELLMSAITIALAYTTSTTLAGYFQAWVAKKMGDDTPELAGFLTLNPLAHIDILGALCLFVLGLGWGRFVPIDVFSLSGWRLLIVFLSNPFMYALIACVALITLLKLFGVAVVNLATLMVSANIISVAAFANVYPASSSFLLAVALILVVLVHVGIMFAVLNFILSGFRCVSLLVLHRTRAEPNDLLMFMIPFALMVFFVQPLEWRLMAAIAYVANVLAPFIGAA